MSERSTPDAAVAMALAYVRRGWSLVPLAGKIPTLRDWTALPTTTEAEVIAYARAGNIGIRTGGISGLAVLDVDAKHGGFDSLASLGVDLRDVPRVRTGSGGLHLYFAYPTGGLRNSAGKLGAGLDIRADGGQVVGPPSIHPDTGAPYVWEVAPRDALPPFPPALLDRLRHREPTGTPNGGAIPQGQRNDALTSLAGAMRRKGLSEGAILAALQVENTEKCSPPLGDSEVQAIAHSVARYEPQTEPPKAAKPPAQEHSPVPRLADLLDETACLIDKYVTLPHAEVAMLVACWIANTYTFKHFRYCGYLALRSATPRCGKSRLLQLVALVSNGEPPVTGTPSAALLIRRTRAVRVLDEVDRLRNADRETYGDVLAVLNIAFDAAGCFEKLEKTKGGAWEAKQYDVYGPFALAGIEKLADTLGDRAFSVQMKRAPHRLPRLNRRKMTEAAARIRSAFRGWDDQHGEAVEAVYGALPDALPDLASFDDRFQDIAEPLIVLATLADDERPNGTPIVSRLLAGLRAAAGQREPSGRERELSAVLDFVEDRLPVTAEEIFLPSAELIEAFREHPDLSRIESGRALAGFLKHFELSPRTNTAKTVRGYIFRREWVSEWRARYTSSRGQEAQG